ncbi:uncharacterized protein [Ptychodera flava]|uniref:uncharacterized protein isoform X2 n=1 Tax=Ptychodera flava TaxID=63121 RepID=UPI00396A28D3
MEHQYGATGKKPFLEQTGGELRQPIYETEVKVQLDETGRSTVFQNIENSHIKVQTTEEAIKYLRRKRLVRIAAIVTASLLIVVVILAVALSLTGHSKFLVNFTLLEVNDVQIEYVQEYADTSSDAFQNISIVVEQTFDSIFLNGSMSSKYNSSTVTAIRMGSVVVETTVLFDLYSNIYTEDVFFHLVDGLTRDDHMTVGMVVNVSTLLVIEATDSLCERRRARLKAACDQNETCVEIKCTEDGEFSPVQCLGATQDAHICFCVTETGRTILESAVYNDQPNCNIYRKDFAITTFQPDLLDAIDGNRGLSRDVAVVIISECLRLREITMGRCLTSNRFDADDCWICQCQEDGGFERTQCVENAFYLYCFCVDERGVVIGGSDAFGYRPRCEPASVNETEIEIPPLCVQKHHASQLQCRLIGSPSMNCWIATCDEYGGFEPIQCLRIQLLQYCWCIDDNGFTIEGTFTREKRPNCSAFESDTKVSMNKTDWLSTIKYPTTVDVRNDYITETTIVNTTSNTTMAELETTSSYKPIIKDLIEDLLGRPRVNGTKPDTVTSESSAFTTKYPTIPSLRHDDNMKITVDSETSNTTVDELQTAISKHPISTEASYYYVSKTTEDNVTFNSTTEKSNSSTSVYPTTTEFRLGNGTNATAGQGNSNTTMDESAASSLGNPITPDTRHDYITETTANISTASTTIAGSEASALGHPSTIDLNEYNTTPTGDTTTPTTTRAATGESDLPTSKYFTKSSFKTSNLDITSSTATDTSNVSISQYPTTPDRHHNSTAKENTQWTATSGYSTYTKEAMSTSAVSTTEGRKINTTESTEVDDKTAGWIPGNILSTRMATQPAIIPQVEHSGVCFIKRVQEQQKCDVNAFGSCWVPQCTRDGEFTEIQCMTNVRMERECWCVNERGEFLEYATVTDDEVPNCNNGTSKCSILEFDCQNGLCIPFLFTCDGDNDCSNGLDELNCNACLLLEYNSYTCSNGSCVSFGKVCDGVKDCIDGSDETDCDQDCLGYYHYMCPAAVGEIPKCTIRGQLCDGIEDCPGGHDEQGCSPACPSHELWCGNTTCVDRFTSLCDGIVDCADALDERNCPCSEYRCDDGLSCFPYLFLCDGWEDCIDESDENPAYCPGSCEYSTGLVCVNSKTCLLPDQICDSVPDCDDTPFDEMFCTANHRDFCRDYEYYCGSTGCFHPSLFVCDGYMECSDGEDELHCSGGCPFQHQYQCSDGTCIIVEWMCDGVEDCDSGEDEEDACFTDNSCDYPDATPCASFGTKCIPEDWLCDDYVDCEYAYDESLCEGCKGFQCRSEGFGVGDCIDESWVCDGFPDCPFKDDEEGCTGTVTAGHSEDLSCPNNLFRCEYSLAVNDQICIPMDWVCDGFPDCPGNDDEGDHCQTPAPQSQCEELNIMACASMTYSQTFYPTPWGIENLEQANTYMALYSALAVFQCSPAYILFGCSVFAPECIFGIPRNPCREFCEMVRSDCSDLFQMTLGGWPPELDCLKFPGSVNDTTCLTTSIS